MNCLLSQINCVIDSWCFVAFREVIPKRNAINYMVSFLTKLLYFLRFQIFFFLRLRNFTLTRYEPAALSKLNDSNWRNNSYSNSFMYGSCALCEIVWIEQTFFTKLFSVYIGNYIWCLLCMGKRLSHYKIMFCINKWTKMRWFVCK